MHIPSIHLYIVLLTFIFTIKGEAQGNNGEFPPILPIRFLENYEYLKDTIQQRSVFDPLKFIPLNKTKSVYLSTGGEVKVFYESLRNRSDEGEGYLLTRFMLHADIHIGDRFRIFVQPASGIESFRTAPPRPIDRDELFLLNFFADYRLGDSKHGVLTARIGRQELNYGSGRLVTIREGPNVRHYWEGLSLLYRSENWHLDAFFTKYGTNEPGVFDNPIFDGEETFWGAYWQSQKPMVLGARAEAYYFGFIDEVSHFFNANGEEKRHSVGARFFNNGRHWDVDTEVTAQFGKAGNSAIGALGFFGNVGYTFNKEIDIEKRVGLKLDYFTGDHDATDAKLNTFNPMYPRQGYYRGAGALYAANYWDIHPSFRIQKDNAFSFLIDWTWYWRATAEDGLYIGGSGIPLLAPTDSSKKYLGNQLDFLCTYSFNRFLTGSINYSRFFSGGFVKDNPTPAEISDFLNLSLLFRL